MSMLDVLEDMNLFRNQFCSEKTIENLAEIDPDDLRKVLLNIYKVTAFNCAATPELWRPDPSPQPIVVLGCMNSNGKIKMDAPRFGLCTDAPAKAKRGATEIYLWVDHRALDKLPRQFQPFKHADKPFNWRLEELRKNKPNKFFRLSEPLFSKDAGHRNLADIMVEHVNLTILLKALYNLIRQPGNSISRSLAAEIQSLGLDAGCYTPKAISDFNASV